MTDALRVAGLWACITLVAAAAYAQKKPQSCGNDRLLTVTVVGSPTDTEGQSLYSDGGGAYVSGVGKVDARLQIDNCYQDFILNLNLSSRKLVTFTAAYGVATVGFANFDQIATVPLTPLTGDEQSLQAFCATVPNNYAGCGIDDASGRFFVRRSATLQFNVGGDNRLIFNKAPAALESWKKNICLAGGDQRPCQTSFVKVFHTIEGNVETWELEPESANTYPGMMGDEPLAAQIELTRKGEYRFIGTHVLPFRMMLTAALP